MPYLPGDMVEEILSRVPATSLKRLQYTCKQWNCLFNNKRFARKHFHKATKQYRFLISRGNIFRVCSTSVDFHGDPSIELKGEIGLNNSIIDHVCHCDGLLLCTITKDNTRILVIWNPCTGQTRWIQPRDGYKTSNTDIYTLASYKDKKFDGNSYKILSYRLDLLSSRHDFAICEIGSKSWRILDVTPDCELLNFCTGHESLKGKTYWCAWDGKEKHLGIFLVSFDYTTEIFERLFFPFHCLIECCETIALSVVREAKLFVLIQRIDSPWTGTWVTNKIDDETKVVSWSKVLKVHFPECDAGTTRFRCLLVDEEKKKITMMWCVKCTFFPDAKSKDLIYIVREDDNKVTPVDFGVDSFIGSSWPFNLNYVPSLVRIECARPGA